MDFRNKQPGKIQEYVENMLDLREYDVPYHVRFAIDNGKS
jgi:DNA polymerase elongation subunit (family B)